MIVKLTPDPQVFVQEVQLCQVDQKAATAEEQSGTKIKQHAGLTAAVGVTGLCIRASGSANTGAPLKLSLVTPSCSGSCLVKEFIGVKIPN